MQADEVPFQGRRRPLRLDRRVAHELVAVGMTTAIRDGMGEVVECPLDARQCPTLLGCALTFDELQ